MCETFKYTLTLAPTVQSYHINTQIGTGFGGRFQILETRKTTATSLCIPSKPESTFQILVIWFSL